MNVLIIGKGGREHAIADAVKRSKRDIKLFIAPGNDGMRDLGTLVNIKETDNDNLLKFAIENCIDLTIVGPEVSLANGVVDSFSAKGLKIFGPTKKAALIESSKEYAKNLMKKYDIPTAKYEVFQTLDEATKYVNKHGVPVVIKYDGLASGKGVTVAFSIDEAHKALIDIFLDEVFGSSKVVIEDYLDGREYSLMAFVNGDKVYPMETAKDHKRIFDNDLGPNTGGMGAYSPVSFITKEIYDYSVSQILEKTAKAMVLEENPFVGVLYAGLILSPQGPQVIEFNARFGDPETEVVLPRLESDFIDVILGVLNKIDLELSWSKDTTLGVVLASKGYPQSYKKGYPIMINGNPTLYHMGTKLDDNGYKTDGGRVLFVLGKGETFDCAFKNAYNAINNIKCDNLVYRHDIGLTK